MTDFSLPEVAYLEEAVSLISASVWPSIEVMMMGGSRAGSVSGMLCGRVGEVLSPSIVSGGSVVTRGSGIEASADDKMSIAGSFCLRLEAMIKLEYQLVGGNKDG
jgi:hypothetical protein